MAVRCRDEAEKVLGAHFESFADIVSESVRYYYKFYGERAHTHESWTRCSIIRDEIKERLTAYCESTSGFRPLHDGNATFFDASRKFTIRIKKLSDNLRANTGKTQYSFDFDRQVPVQVELLEDFELTHIYLGYVPTENDPLNPLIYLVCNDEIGGIAWNIPLVPSSMPPSAVLEPTPPATPMPDVPRRIRVKPSNGTNKKTEK